MAKRLLIFASFLLQLLNSGQAISQTEPTERACSFDRQILAFAVEQTRVAPLSEEGRLELRDLSRRFALTGIVEFDSAAVPEIRDTLTRLMGKSETQQLVKMFLIRRVTQQNLNGFFDSPDVLRICGFQNASPVAIAKLQEFTQRLDSEFFAKRTAELNGRFTKLCNSKLNVEQRKIANSLLGLEKNSLNAGRVTELFKNRFPLSFLATGTSTEAILDCGLSKEQSAKLQQLSKQFTEKLSSEMMRPNSNSTTITSALQSIEAETEVSVTKLLTIEQLDRLLITHIHESVELNGIAEIFRWNEFATAIGLTQAECDDSLAAAKVLDESCKQELSLLRSQQFSQVLRMLSNDQRDKLTSALYSPLEL